MKIRERGRSRLAFMLSPWTVALVACGGTQVDQTPSPSSPVSGVNGKCVGTPIDSRKMSEISSCQAQGEKWVSVYKECDPSGQACSHKTRNDPGYFNDYGESECRKVLGCEWEAPDGTVRRNPDLGGTCSGDARPCQEQPKVGCLAGCEWDSGRNVCKDYNGENIQCGSYSVQTDPQTLYHHPNHTIWQCNSILGCKFTRTDGTVVP